MVFENQEEIVDILIEKNGNLMICGDLDKLYDELMSNIIMVIMKIKNYPREYCVKLIEDWKFTNRIIIEKWL